MSRIRLVLSLLFWTSLVSLTSLLHFSHALRAPLLDGVDLSSRGTRRQPACRRGRPRLRARGYVFEQPVQAFLAG